MNKSLLISSNSIKEILYYFFILLISFLSFLLFSPLYHPEFNSDQAIHVLMSARNNYPEGIYYWGQNRLGSFLPEVTSYFVSIFKIHPLTAISIVNHLFLLTIFFVLQSVLKNSLHKIFLALLIFFPLYTFNALLLIGHPYCSQLFAGTLAVFFIYKSYEKIIHLQSFKNISIWVYGLLSAFLFGISIWISESSLLFIVYVALYFLFEKEKRKLFFDVLFKEKAIGISFLLSFLAIGIFWIIKIKQFKAYYPENELYDQIFINTRGEILQQFNWMWEKFSSVIFFREEGMVSNGIFAWSCLIFVSSSVFQMRQNKSPFSVSLFITLCIGFIALFFSTWNYRSEFEPRYFTILYPFLTLLILVHAEKLKFNPIIKLIPGILISLAVLKNNSSYFLKWKPGVVARFSGFSDLEPGGMIGNYWQVYRACSISPFHLTGIPKEGDPLRNKHMLEEVMSEKIIYVIKTDFYPDERPMPDTLVQYGYVLIKSSEKEKEVGSVYFYKYKVLN